MLIVCPKCFAQYEIPDALLDEKKNGTEVRFHCSACQNYFVERIGNLSHVKTVAEPQKGSSSDGGYQRKEDTSLTEKSPSLLKTESENADSETVRKNENQINQEFSAFGRPFSPNGISIDTDLIPEEFKPVHSSKKNNILIVFLYLVIVFVCCYFAFVKSDWIINQFSFLGETKSIQTDVLKKENETLSSKNSAPLQKSLTETQNKKDQTPNQNQTIISDVKTEIVDGSSYSQNLFHPHKETNLKTQTEKDLKRTEKGLLPSHEITPLKEKKSDLISSQTSLSLGNRSLNSETVLKDSDLKNKDGADKNSGLSEKDFRNTQEKSTETGAAALIASLSNVPSDETVIDPFQNMDDRQSMALFENKDLPLNQTGYSENFMKKEIENNLKTTQPLVTDPKQGNKMNEPLKHEVNLSSKEIDPLFHDLRIRDVSYRIEEDETYSKVLLQGVVANIGLTDQATPELVAYLYDQNGSVLSSKNIVLTDPIIQSNEIQSFYSTIVSPKGVDHVRVRFLGENSD